MATKKRKKGQEELAIKGQVTLAENQGIPDELELMAYAFDRVGRLLGQDNVNAKGGFAISLDLDEAVPIELVIAPKADAKTVRQGEVYSEHIAAEQLANGPFEIRPLIPDYIWWPWRPIRICISGHVRKLTDQGACAVPFTKVEIFDVDRERCYWPWLRDRFDLLKDLKVVRVPDLIPDPPFPPGPFPGPDPGPFRQRFDDVQLNPQPLPPREGMAGLKPMAFNPGAAAGLNLQSALSAQLGRQGLVGEIAQAKPEVAEALQDLTLQSRLAPWLIYRHCYYSTAEICETYTDECGYFRCCFRWWPFHFRRGRLRYDRRPDIILKVTQVINGVPTVIYLDPYSSTRWNTTSTHIDLFLDDERIVCGTCPDDTVRPEGTATFFTRIGNDEVYRINQATGLYSEGGVSQVAYGSTLRVHGQFGDTLSRHQAISGATAPYYYKLSYTTDGVNFTPVTTGLDDTRVNKTTLFSESHNLGPKTVGSTPSLYEIRDFGGYYWYNPDWIGTWNTLIEPDTDKYTLRLEVYDSNGTKMGSSLVNYVDGTVAPPAVLPPMGNQCDLVLTIDNKPPVVGLTVIGFEDELNDCGVIKWTPTLMLNFHATASQENGRLRQWGLYYTKGFGGGVTYLASGVNPNGTPASISTTVSGAPLLAGLTTTCAFGLKVWARSHIRNGYGFIYYEEDIQALTIEKCA